MSEKRLDRKSKNTLFRLISYITKYYKKEMIIVLICLFITSITSVMSSFIIQRVIDNVITPGIENGYAAVSDELIRITIFMIVAYGIGVLASFVFSRLLAVITQGSLRNLRQDMFKAMEKLPIRYFDTTQHGSIMSRYTNDTDAIRQLIGQSITSLLQSLLTILAIFIMMLFYSIWLTLIVLAVIIIMLIITKYIGGGSAKYMKKQQVAIGEVEGYVEELINGQKVVKVFNYENKSKDNFRKVNDQLFDDSEKANKYANILFPILANLGNLTYVIVAFVGGILLINGVTNLSITGFGPLKLGVVVSFLTMSRSISKSIGQTSQQIGMLAMGLAGAKRVFDLIDNTPESDDGYVTLVNIKKEAGEIVETDERTDCWAWKHYHKKDGTTTYERLRGAVELEHVNFGYTDGKEVLHDVSFYAKPGQKIALVGATGAGKTTITNLINRFYDINSGKIRYDGINIEKIKKPDLRKSLGIVLQDVNLFTGTVMDNIRYGRLDATDEECIEAAKLANAHDFITRLPKGYDTVISGNGDGLSQGQRQLLSIARAAIADTPAMILDEATSSIDTRTEALVQKGMDNLMKGRTVFVIAHRLSTIRNSDAIIVLDHGRIIERGSHDSLLAQKGIYYQLYTGKFELE